MAYEGIRCSMVSLDLCKEYVNMATFKIAVLLPIKSWTFWYIERRLTWSYTEVIHFQKWSGFWPTLYICSACRILKRHRIRDSVSNSSSSDFLADFFGHQLHHKMSYLDEFDSYLRMANTSSAVLFWNDNKCQLPKMADITRQLLCCPATSSSSERTFDMRRTVLTERRYCSTPPNLAKTCFYRAALYVQGLSCGKGVRPSVSLSVCVSVCLSVTRVNCDKTNEGVENAKWPFLPVFARYL